MALTATQAAAMVHEMLDDLAADLSTMHDGDERAIGDYTYPLEFALRDCGLAAISEATTQAQERAILQGMQYYAYLRLFRKFGARASQQQGAGASGMHLAIDWSSTAKTLRMHVAECKLSYGDALKAIGKGLDTNPALSASASKPVIADLSSDEGARLTRVYDGLPWLTEDLPDE